MRLLPALVLVSLPLMGLAPEPQAAGLSRGQVGLRVSIEGKGDVVIRLDEGKAPQACARIKSLAAGQFYDGQKFFKVVKQPKPFLVQCGDPNSRTKPMDDSSLGTWSSGTKIPYEPNDLKHVRGAVGLARLSSNKNTGDSQFYIMLDNAPFLDSQYTVFGQVVSGMDIVDKIALGDKIRSVSVVSQ